MFDEAGLREAARQKFEEELGKRGLKSALPDIAYKDPNFEWDYGADDH